MLIWDDVDRQLVMSPPATSSQSLFWLPFVPAFNRGWWQDLPEIASRFGEDVSCANPIGLVRLHIAQPPDTKALIDEVWKILRATFIDEFDRRGQIEGRGT
jgi:hypothetical protein